MTMHEELAGAVRQALEKAPCSDRALALAAGLSQSTVSRIRNKERGCGPETAKALADALAEWAEACREAEGDIRRRLQQEGEHNDS